MKRTLTFFVLLVALAAWAATCFVAVDATQYVIVKRFGEPVRTILEPGLQWKLPAPLESVVRFDNRLQVFEDPAPGGPPKEYLTRDKKNVEVAASACWRIGRTADNVLKFLETVGDGAGANVRLADIIKAQFNARLGASDFEMLVSTDPAKRHWAETVEAIHTACADSARESFGIELVDLRVVRLNFPAQNRRSVFDRMRAERERIANQYRSEGDAEAIKIRAEADAQRERITAEARRDYETIRGEADAESTRIYGEAYSADPEFYRFLRTLESYETGIDADTILILPAEADYFRLLLDPELPAPAASPQPTQPGAPTEPLTNAETVGQAGAP